MRVRYCTVAVVVALGLVVGCADNPVGVEPRPAEDPADTSETPPDLDAVRDLLDDPLVHELMALHGDQVVAQMADELVSLLSAPPDAIQITSIRGALARLQERLTPEAGEMERELPRAVLGLIVADAAAVLAAL